MKLEYDGKTFYEACFLGGGPEGWAERIMKKTLEAEQEKGNICFLITDGKEWCLMKEYKNGEFVEAKQ